MVVGTITEDVIMTTIVTDMVTVMGVRHIMDVMDHPIMVIMATMDHPIMDLMVVKCISDLAPVGHMDRMDHIDRAQIPGDVTHGDR